MTFHTDDTIVAIASAAGGAARGIVRVSGPDVALCVAACFQGARGERLDEVSGPTAVFGHWRTDEIRQALPATLYLWPTRRSFTREPLAEVHTLGSPPLLDAVVRSLCQSGARLAERGEFTLRAFLAGRIDLTQAEAVLGVIDARGQMQLAGALSQLAGGLSTPLNQLRDTLVDLLAHLEAGLDFVEEDIEFISQEELLARLGSATATVDDLLEQMKQRGVTGDEVRVALLGPPNAGKSSLLNALAGDAAAIVSPQAGTTRDYVARRVDCDGVACLLIDTAGAQSTAEAVSIAAIAQGMTQAQSEQADVKLICWDASQQIAPSQQQAWESQISAGGQVLVWTKCDLLNPHQADVAYSAHHAIFTSAKTGAGLAELRTAIARAAESHDAEMSQVVGGTAVRCRESLQSARDGLQRAHDATAAGHGEELAAAEIRVALAELGKVVGTVYTDDILDRIFSRFCIGK